MKLIKTNDTLAVSTPLYIGASSDVELAIVCEHDWVDTSPAVPFLNCMTGFEQCRHCVATRYKVTAETPELLDQFLGARGTL